MNEKNKRMTNFDILKGISVFLIIQIHYPSMFRKEYIDAIARIGVPLFFMISGYYIGNTRCTVKRIRKTIEILVVTELAYCVVYFWMGKKYIVQMAFENEMRNLMLGQLRIWFPGWYLISLVYAYLFYIIISECKIPKEIQYMIIVGLLFLLWIMQRQERLSAINEYSFIFRGIPFVLIGKMVRNEQEKIKLKKNGYWVFIAFISVATIVLERCFWNRRGMLQFFYIFIGTVPLAVSIFSLALKSVEWNAPFLAFIGEKLSTYMYCCHLIVGEFVNFKNETFDFFWFCAFSFLTSLGIYYIVQCVKRKKHILAKIPVSR